VRSARAAGRQLRALVSAWLPKRTRIALMAWVELGFLHLGLSLRVKTQE